MKPIADPVQNELINGCRGFTDLILEPRSFLVAGNDFEQGIPGALPVALQSSIVLSGPASVQEDLLLYNNISISRGQVEELLSKWKETFFDVSINILLLCIFIVIFIVGN